MSMKMQYFRSKKFGMGCGMMSLGRWASGYGQFMAMGEKPALIDVRGSLGDISKAYAGFGYVPRYGVGDGLKETIGWFMRGT